MTHVEPARAEDIEHLHQMVDHLTADEVQRAMDLLEDIFYSRPEVRSRIEAAAQGPKIPMDEVLAEYGLTEDDLQVTSEAGVQSGKAA